MWYELGLTPKEVKFAEAYVESRGDTPGSVLKAYNCSTRNCARVMGHHILKRERVRRYIEYLLLKADFPEALVRSLRSHLDAKKPFVVNGDVIYADDHVAQGKAIDKILKLLEIVGD